MAVLTKHILGTPSGAIGDSVCFTTWKGKACVRALASKVNDPNTEAQQAVRAKFSLIGQTLVPLAEVINIGWKAYEKSGRKACTQLNAYVKYHLKDVPEADLFNGEYPDFDSINADKLLLSRGGLGAPTMVTYNNGRVTLTFPEDVDTTEIAYAVLYNPTMQEMRWGNAEVTGTSVNIDAITVPADWQGTNYLYAFVTNAEGKKACNSVYYGTVQ